MDDDYSKVTIASNNWPTWEDNDGEWVRRWRITFVEMLPELDPPSTSLDEHDLSLRSQRIGPRELEVQAVTQGDPWSDELYVHAMLRLLVRIETVFGRIETIQGEPRSAWWPFRSNAG